MIWLFDSQILLFIGKGHLCTMQHSCDLEVQGPSSNFVNKHIAGVWANNVSSCWEALELYDLHLVGLMAAVETSYVLFIAHLSQSFTQLTRVMMIPL